MASESEIIEKGYPAAWKDLVTRVVVVFIGKEGAIGWPYYNFDVKEEAERIKKALMEEVAPKVSGVEFYGWYLLDDPIKSESLIPEIVKDADGILAIPLNQEFADSAWTPHPILTQLAETDKPMIVYSRPFSVYWDMGSVLERMGRVHTVTSEDLSAIIPALEALRAFNRIRHTKILLLKDYEFDKNAIDPRLRDARWTGPAYLARIKDTFGIDVVRVTSKEFIEVYNQIPIEEARAEAEKIISQAKGVEPPLDDVVKAARGLLAVRRLLEKYGANAWTWDCLTALRQRTLPISLCLAISVLNNEGIPSGCEADMDALITMIMGMAVCNRPAFMGDPVIDEAKRVMYIAHCTAATQMLGKGSKPFSFRIRTHAESHREVGVETLFEPGEVTVFKLQGGMTTRGISFPQYAIDSKFAGYTLMAEKAEALGHLESERGCRSKIVIKIPDQVDVNEFKHNFYCEHKIVCYGDHVERLRVLSKFLKIGFFKGLYIPLSRLTTGTTETST